MIDESRFNREHCDDACYHNYSMTGIIVCLLVDSRTILSLYVCMYGYVVGTYKLVTRHKQK